MIVTGSLLPSGRNEVGAHPELMIREFERGFLDQTDYLVKEVDLEWLVLTIGPLHVGVALPASSVTVVLLSVADYVSPVSMTLHNRHDK